MHALNIIRKPVVTEKTAILEEKRIYTFWVSPKSTKIDVKKAFQELYGAEVAAVRIVKTSEKMRKLRKGVYNKRKESQKAYITLKGKTKLDLNRFGKAEKENKVKLAVSKSADKTEKAAKAPKATKKTDKLPKSK